MTKIATKLALAYLFLVVTNHLFAQGTAFTYQGRLTSGTNLANGNYGMTFALYGAAMGGSPLAGVVTNAATSVNNGVFTVTLDFGSGVFTGAPRWLELAAQTNGTSGAYAILSPRQPITAVPYAITAGNFNGILSGASIQDATITTAKIAPNQVVRSLNSLSDQVNLIAGQNISISTNANAIQISAASGAGTGNSGCCIFSERPRFANYIEGAGNVIVNVTNALGYLGRIDWLVTEYVPNGQAQAIHSVSITIDDDTPQTFYLKATADTTPSHDIVYNSGSTGNPVKIGDYYEWFGGGVLPAPLSFTNRLLITCSYPTPICQAPVGNYEFNPQMRCGYVRAIYVLRK